MSISCKHRCEADVAVLNELVQRGRTVYQKTSRTYLRTGIFTLLLGAVFFLIGISSMLNSRPNFFLMVVGGLFVGWGISYFISAKRFGQN
jgi:RsiW-degrading membrane proteinase PrsW (M82 family)